MLYELWFLQTNRRRPEIPKAPPHSFLILATLLWAGNFVVGGPLAEVLPPFGLNFLRWCVACALLVPLALLYEGAGFIRPALRMWRSLLVMAITGVFMFNSLVYPGAHADDEHQRRPHQRRDAHIDALRGRRARRGTPDGRPALWFGSLHRRRRLGGI